MKTDLLDIRNCDCMELMAQYGDNHFDLAIVDPPYGLGLKMINSVDSNKRNGRNNRSIVKHDDKAWNEHPLDPDYYQAACERIENETRQLTLI